jgi:hypothetical protein
MRSDISNFKSELHRRIGVISFDIFASQRGWRGATEQWETQANSVASKIKQQLSLHILRT